MATIQKITPCLWFNGNAEEAVKYYCSIFKNSKIKSKTHYTDGGPAPEGSVLTIEFQLEGQDFVALNGGADFPFTEAISLMVGCRTQAEIDELWSKLGANGGQEVQCGWIKDKYGLAWQVFPIQFMEMIHDSDPARVKRAMSAMMKMKKLDLATLEQAYRG